MRPAYRSLGEDVARPTVIVHAEDWHVGVPRPFKQIGDALDYLFTPMERAAKGKHAC